MRTVKKPGLLKPSNENGSCRFETNPNWLVASHSSSAARRDPYLAEVTLIRVSVVQKIKIKGGRGPAAVTTYLYDHTTRRICDRQVNDKNDSNNSIYLRTCVRNHQLFRPFRRTPIQFSSAGFPHDYIRFSRVGGRPGCPRPPRPSQTRICLPTACYSLARSTWMPWIRSEFPQYFAISSSSSEKKTTVDTSVD